MSGVCWDEDGAYEAAATRIIRANQRGTGCRLTPEMVAAVNFAQGDGDHWQELTDAITHPASNARLEQGTVV